MLYNDPKTFREDMLKGYVAAYPDYVVEVPGGVARATKMPEGKITVINGGVQMVIYFPIYKIIFPEGEQIKN